jgi:hypothetical protein
MRAALRCADHTGRERPGRDVPAREAKWEVEDLDTLTLSFSI